MKRLTLLLSFSLLCVVCALAQEPGVVDNPGTVAGLASFAGITALVSLLGTQLAKLVPYIAEHAWCKILCSVGIGILASLVSWGLQLAGFMDGFQWWQALLAGVASGLSACGFYDLVKAVSGLFRKDGMD